MTCLGGNCRTVSINDIKSNFGDVYLAADQPFRQWDLALDISEEQDMDDDKVKAIHDFCISNGANAANPMVLKQKQRSHLEVLKIC